MALQVKAVRWVLAGLVLTTGTAGALNREGQLARIIDEGRLGEHRIAADGKLLPPGLPASLVESKGDVCVSVGYNIRANGTTSNWMVLKSWSSIDGEDKLDPTYAAEVRSVAVTAVKGWKFRDADGGSRIQPLFTATTFSFTGNGEVDTAELRNRCRISDLTAHIQSVKSTRFLPGSRDTFAAEQAMRRDTQAMQMIEQPGRAVFKSGGRLER